MYYVYVLKSLKNGKRYVGLSSRDPLIRVQEHNRSMARWTWHCKPFTLIYQEVFLDKAKARQREKFLKTGNGRDVLSDILNRKKV